MFRSGLALLHADLGRLEEARESFDALAVDQFRALPRDVNWLNAMDELAQVCAALGDREHAATLYALLLPYADQNVVVAFADACEGSVSRYLGLLATTAGRWDAAARHFEAALAMNQRIRARPLLAVTAVNHALAGCPAPSGEEQADRRR